MSGDHEDAHMSAGPFSRSFKLADGMRWITVGPADQPDTAIVLYPPTATPGLTDDEKNLIAEMMAGNLVRIQETV